mmetsp:Transcript_29517/g.90474  ORF Transcript_29517/g.90474 Transcript_29517/m.90474 type:complete len:270 (+) Transcript_29517:489-1298(+)
MDRRKLPRRVGGWHGCKKRPLQHHEAAVGGSKGKRGARINSNSIGAAFIAELDGASGYIVLADRGGCEPRGWRRAAAAVYLDRKHQVGRKERSWEGALAMRRERGQRSGSNATSGLEGWLPRTGRSSHTLPDDVVTAIVLDEAAQARCGEPCVGAQLQTTEGYSAPAQREGEARLGGPIARGSSMSKNEGDRSDGEIRAASRAVLRGSVVPLPALPSEASEGPGEQQLRLRLLMPSGRRRAPTPAPIVSCLMRAAVDGSMRSMHSSYAG